MPWDHGMPYDITASIRQWVNGQWSMVESRKQIANQILSKYQNLRFYPKVHVLLLGLTFDFRREFRVLDF